MSDYQSPFLVDTDRTLTTAEMTALSGVLTIGAVGAGGVADKVAQGNIHSVSFTVASIASSASAVFKMPAPVGTELQFVYYQNESGVAAVTVNVTKGGTSISWNVSAVGAVGVDESINDWQRIPLTATQASRQAGPAADVDVVDESTEGFTFTITADGSGSVTTGRLWVGYSLI